MSYSYGPSYGRSSGDSPRAIQWAMPWGVGFFVNLLVQVVLGTLVWEAILGGDFKAANTFSGSLLVNHLPPLLGFTAGTWVACMLHRDPSREVPWRHWVAAFTPAAAIQILAFVLGGAEMFGVGALIAQALVLGVGCTAGFLFAKLTAR